MRPLLLASTSVYRRTLLARLALPFEVLAPEVIEEELPREPPAARALRLAIAKAQAVARARPQAIVIGSDQVAAIGEQILHKPCDAAGSRTQLAAASAQRAHFYTACAVIGVQADISLSHIDETTVVFRALGAAEIERYIERDRPFNCAGGFKAETLGIALFERIDSSDPTALIGLPLIWVASALRRCGYDVP
jgi:septum formation protein